MSFRDRIAAWYIAKRIRRGALKMKPFPKAVGAFGMIVGVLSAVAVGLKTGDWTALVPAVTVVITWLSHSATGTGGAEPTP